VRTNKHVHWILKSFFIPGEEDNRPALYHPLFIDKTVRRKKEEGREFVLKVLVMQYQGQVVKSLVAPVHLSRHYLDPVNKECIASGLRLLCNDSIVFL
jgi:hypothetical protein